MPETEEKFPKFDKKTLNVILNAYVEAFREKFKGIRFSYESLDYDKQHLLLFDQGHDYPNGFVYLIYKHRRISVPVRRLTHLKEISEPQVMIHPLFNINDEPRLVHPEDALTNPGKYLRVLAFSSGACQNECLQTLMADISLPRKWSVTMNISTKR